MSYAGEILKAKKQELAGQVAELRKSIKEIEAALELLGESESTRSAQFTDYSGGNSSGGSVINPAIIRAIEYGKNTPSEIHNYLIQVLDINTSKQSISTRLSKMKNDGLIDNSEGGWILIGKEKGPDAQTPEPFKELGPDTGRESAYPASTPEGSIPSGSTTAHQEPARGYSRELDDEIPF